MVMLFESGQYGGICYDLQAAYMCYCPDGHFRTQCSPRSGNSDVIFEINCTALCKQMSNSRLSRRYVIKSTEFEEFFFVSQ